MGAQVKVEGLAGGGEPFDETTAESCVANGQASWASSCVCALEVNGKSLCCFVASLLRCAQFVGKANGREPSSSLAVSLGGSVEGRISYGQYCDFRSLAFWTWPSRAAWCCPCAATSLRWRHVLAAFG